MLAHVNKLLPCNYKKIKFLPFPVSYRFVSVSSFCLPFRFRFHPLRFRFVPVSTWQRNETKRTMTALRAALAFGSAVPDPKTLFYLQRIRNFGKSRHRREIFGKIDRHITAIITSFRQTRVR